MAGEKHNLQDAFLNNVRKDKNPENTAIKPSGEIGNQLNTTLTIINKEKT